MNSREKLEHVAAWLSWQIESLSDGIKTPQDAIKLWDYAQAHDELPEMADEWTLVQLKKALGYYPFKIQD